MFGQDILNNAVHGPSSHESAKETMKAVFGDLKFNPDGTLKGSEETIFMHAVKLFQTF